MHNPSVSILNTPKKNKNLPRALDIHQALDFIEETPNLTDENWLKLRDIAIFTLLYGCGLRISEAVNTNIGDFDNKDFLRIKGKGNKERIVPLLPIVNQSIDNYIAACPYKLSTGEALFLGVRGERISPRIIQRQMEKIRNYMGLPKNITPHSLRPLLPPIFLPPAPICAPFKNCWDIRRSQPPNAIPKLKFHICRKNIKKPICSNNHPTKKGDLNGLLFFIPSQITMRNSNPKFRTRHYNHHRTYNQHDHK